MNPKILNILFAVAGILSITLIGPNYLLARDVTIVGEINDRNELVSSEEGTVYEIAESEIGDKLIYEHRGEKMRVFGKLIRPVQEVSVDELPKGLIEVISYEDVPEQFHQLMVIEPIKKVVKNKRLKKTMEVEMKWYDLDEADMSDYDQDLDNGSRRFTGRQADEPRRSPIRRKDKLRPEERFKSKAKRNHKKILNKIKYDWQGK